jgi:hypothetical protein
MANNSFRSVGAGTTFLSPTDFIVEVDTSAGAVTLILPKIATILGSYVTIQQYIGIRFVDVSNNASVNNITIAGFETDKINGENLIKLDTNGAGGMLSLLGASQWNFVPNSTAKPKPVDILYADLYDAIVNRKLVSGQKYRLTDYRSVNFLNGWNIANNNPTPIESSFVPRQIHTGDNEVLILEAISDYELNPIGNSETFGGDIIEFQGYTNKIGVDFDIYTGQTLPDSSVVSDFNLKWDGTNVYFDMPTGYPALFGHYFYLFAEFNGGAYSQDGCFEPLTPVIAECQYPYSTDSILYGYPKKMSRLSVSADGMKVILLDLVEADYLAYDVDTLYVDTIYSIGDSYGWVTRRNDTQRNINVPFDFRGRKYRRYEVDLSSINPSLGIYYWGQGDNFLGYGTTGNYYDSGCFTQNGYDYYDIEWNGIGGADMYWYAGYNDNNVFLSGFYKNSIEDYFRNNTFGNYTYGNKIGNNFSDNTIGSMDRCSIGYSFSSNLIGYGMQSCIFGSEITNNRIGGSFANNDISFGYFQNNVLPNNCYWITTKTSVGSFNFNLSTLLVSTAYSKTIIRASDNNLYLSYFDGTTQQNVTPITT